jgi:HEPN domain-containing protein
MADEIDRTSPAGLFNTADSYWRAAVALGRAKVKSTHPDKPISFLYYHAIELYLKAFLRMHGHTADELASRKFGHRTGVIAKRAAELGIKFDEEDVEVLAMMASTDAVIRSRYIETGFFRWPAHQALNRTCKSLRDLIGTALKKNKIPVRL